MTTSKINFGVSVPRDLDIDITQFARMAETLGFNSIHVRDHISTPFEPLTTLTALAMKTEKLKLATNILDMNRRNPAITAHATSTLDHLSGGRLILGVGCGMWNWPTYNIPEIGDKGRTMVSRKVSRAEEAIEVLKKFWTDSTVNYKGEFFSFEKASINAKPLQTPHPPIWIAAYGKRMKRIAAELGDGFITQTVTPCMYGEETRQVKRYARTVGKDPRKIKAVYATPVGIGNTHREAIDSIRNSAQILLFRSVRDHADHHNRLAERLGYDRLLPWREPADVSSEDLCDVYLIGTPEEISRKIEEYRKEGMGYVIAMGMRTVESLRLFSDKVISHFRH